MEMDIQKEIGERIAQLPEVVRTAIFESNLSERIRALGANHKLHIDQLDLFEDEIMLIMLGLTKPEEFESHLTTQVKLDQNEAHALAQEVNTEIFLPIRQLMQTPQQATATPPPPQPTPAVHPADVMLSQKTVTVAPTPTPSAPAASNPGTPSINTTAPASSAASTPLAVDPSAPKPYKADPYREPIQ